MPTFITVISLRHIQLTCLDQEDDALFKVVANAPGDETLRQEDTEGRYMQSGTTDAQNLLICRTYRPKLRLQTFFELLPRCCDAVVT